MEVLAEFGIHWPHLHMSTTCCFCLCRSVEHMMPCRHAICDTCVAIFGTINCSAEYHMDLSQCPMCRKSFQFTVRQLPPTKGPVIMTLDGGGVRAMITLGLLRALERRLGSVIKIHQIANFFSGTSVGMLLRWPVTPSQIEHLRPPIARFGVS